MLVPVKLYTHNICGEKWLYEIPGHKCPGCHKPMLIWPGTAGKHDRKVDPDQYYLCIRCIGSLLIKVGTMCANERPPGNLRRSESEASRDVFARMPKRPRCECGGRLNRMSAHDDWRWYRCADCDRKYKGNAKVGAWLTRNGTKCKEVEMVA